MMTDINNFIDEMTNDILNQKRAFDIPIFLNFLKEELENAKITLTVKRYQNPFVNGNHIISSDIAGIKLDLSDHDKEKDAEIEKYKKAFESAKCERNKAVCEYQNEIDELKQKLEIQKKATEIAEDYVETLKGEIERKKNIINQIDYALEEVFSIKHNSAENPNEFEKILKEKVEELKKSMDLLPTEPIKMADWIVHHFKQGEEYPVYMRGNDGEICYVDVDGEKVPVQTGEYGKHREVREIADYLLSYCKYHSEE